MVSGQNWEAVRNVPSLDEVRAVATQPNVPRFECLPISLMPLFTVKTISTMPIAGFVQLVQTG